MVSVCSRYNCQNKFLYLGRLLIFCMYIADSYMIFIEYCLQVIACGLQMYDERNIETTKKS